MSLEETSVRTVAADRIAGIACRELKRQTEACMLRVRPEVDEAFIALNFSWSGEHPEMREEIGKFMVNGFIQDIGGPLGHIGWRGAKVKRGMRGSYSNHERWLILPR